MSLSNPPDVCTTSLSSGCSKLSSLLTISLAESSGLVGVCFVWPSSQLTPPYWRLMPPPRKNTRRSTTWKIFWSTMTSKSGLLLTSVISSHLWEWLKQEQHTPGCGRFCVSKTSLIHAHFPRIRVTISEECWMENTPSWEISQREWCRLMSKPTLVI